MLYKERFHPISQHYLVKSFLILSKTLTSWIFHAFLIKNNVCIVTTCKNIDSKLSPSGNRTWVVRVAKFLSLSSKVNFLVFSSSIFLDFSGVIWWQLNCSNLFPESSLLRKNQKSVKIFPSVREKLFFRTLGKISTLGKILYSKTGRHWFFFIIQGK